jgi:hypothetical protein
VRDKALSVPETVYLYELKQLFIICSKRGNNKIELSHIVLIRKPLNQQVEAHFLGNLGNIDSRADNLKRVTTGTTEVQA